MKPASPCSVCGKQEDKSCIATTARCAAAGTWQREIAILYLDKRGGIPLELVLLTGQAVPVELADLNGKDLPDTFWLGIDGRSRGDELKQPGEVLGNLKALDEQLMREYDQVDELRLTVIGIILPCFKCREGCRIFKMSVDGKTGYSMGIKKEVGRKCDCYHQDYGGYRNKLESYRYWGINCVEIPSILALAVDIVARYRWSQMLPAAHQTFRTAIKPKLQMPVGNPYELSLQGLIDPASGHSFIGPDRAKVLMEAFRSPYALFSAKAKDIGRVDGIGPKTAAGVLRSVGRGD